MSGHLLTAFDIQMQHGPEQTDASAEEEGGMRLVRCGRSGDGRVCVGGRE